MKLYIAEKPSLGRAIAAALPKPHQKHDGYIKVGGGDVVTWCIGHILEQSEPEAYDSVYKKWQLEHLPIVPSEWKLTPKPGTRKQFTAVKKLIKQAGTIIHCGDPDREGQLLVDEVINHVGVNSDVKQRVQRCLISDLNTSAVKQSLSLLKPNSDFSALSISALARSRADWLYGINMTRAYTLQGQKVGYKGVVSIGRVQTPLLGLVVRRDLELENFTPVNYYEVNAHIISATQPLFTAKWKPSDACLPYCDSEGRVLNKGLAENVIRRIHGQPATVKHVEHKKKKQGSPLPYNLSALQIDAAKRFGMSAKVVLDTCQSLYETHKIITYPRSDNRYLPSEHYHQASGVIEAISQNASLNTECEGANVALKSRVWDDKKVGAHHAIIPTSQHHKGVLSRAETQVYELIAIQYLMQFYPSWEYVDGVVELEIAGGSFITKARNTTAKGWKALLKEKVKTASGSGNNKQSSNSLPDVAVGQVLTCEKGELLDKQTQPPAPFNDASLLAAMTGISRFVTDPDIKKVLKETDGLGTEATRANIIELLFKRQFLKREGKTIRSTEIGRGLIASLPEIMTLPDMTAQWESSLDKISLKEQNYIDFMSPLQKSLLDLVGYASCNLPIGLKGLRHTKSNQFKSKRKSTKKAHKRAKPQKV
ncbi:DNA topoisomerase III [Alkalimarinus sediminis]|uniref:DNA topoisomerase 3 n=1 Tax=Alkalimarinus sediminis TaxID=1632866 RepID=A0A9E8HL50_9ALTE|nr:DNA topoisomerase III [Alkalimarinus sediminis]UZW76330.1 DNA topoisomerase III [Alkalimarinus sediminis]